MISAYRPVPVTLQAVRFDGSNLAEVRQLTADCPGITAFTDGGLLVIREDGRLDRPVRPGMWVSRTPEGQVTVHGDQAFSRLYEAA